MESSIRSLKNRFPDNKSLRDKLARHNLAYSKYYLRNISTLRDYYSTKVEGGIRFLLNLYKANPEVDGFIKEEQENRNIADRNRIINSLFAEEQLPYAHSDSINRYYNYLETAMGVNEEGNMAINFGAMGELGSEIADKIASFISFKVEEYISRIHPDAKTVVKFTTSEGTKFYRTLTYENYMEFCDIIKRGYIENITTGHASDDEFLTKYDMIENVEFIDIEDESESECSSTRTQFGFNRLISFEPYEEPILKYFDLSSLQIYNNYQKINRTNCFLFTLQQAGVPSEIVYNIQHDMGTNEFFNMKDLKKVSGKYGIQFNVLYHEALYKNHKIPTPTVGDPVKTVDLLVLDKHAMLNKEIRFNVNYFNCRLDMQRLGIPLEKQILVQKRNGKNSFRFYKSIDEIPLLKPHMIIEKLIRYGGFVDLSKLDVVNREVEVIPIPKLAPCNFAPFEYERPRAPKLPIKYLDFEGLDMELLAIKKSLFDEESIYEITLENGLILRDIRLFNCETVEEFNSLRRLIKCELDMDICEYRTISSLANDFMNRFIFSKVPNLYKISGSFDKFVRKCIYGGRVCCPRPIHVTEEVVDLDVHSLYPYSLTKLAFPVGIPVSYSEDTNLDEVDYGYFKIKVISRKSVDFPTINIDKPIIHVDIQTLRDLVKYEDLEYEIIKGYYYKETYRIPDLFDIINKLYKLRATNSVFKLMLNSIYGKTIQKPVLTKKLFFRDNDKAMKYIRRNFHSVIGFEEKNGGVIISAKKEFINSYSLSMIGCSILSKSKHIMNRWLQNDDLDVYYTDTDSLFIRAGDVDKLARYMGKGMGCLDNEFGDKATVESIFAGKKRYLNVFADGSYRIRIIGKNKDEISDPRKYFLKLIEK